MDHVPHSQSSSTDGLTVAPALDLVVESADVPAQQTIFDRRALNISLLAILLGIVAALIAQLLIKLINFFTNLSFFGTFSLEEHSPAHHQLGALVILVPVAGALVIGLMARFGSKAIRGHGIPEAMEQVLTNESRIPARITFLKPISAAISIGTGGPFGAEGPIIATGGALGSVIGQALRITAAERKTLLAAGAAAGMTATFGSPVAAVLLAIELLLFEFRARSIIAVALASVAAAGMRAAMVGLEPVFPMPDLLPPAGGALAVYVLIGALMGVFAVGVTKIVYAIEDAFEHLPIHWMWWPAIGALAVGLVGYFVPRTLGVGYENITDLLSGKLAFGAIALLCSMKFVSWSIALGSGTSGGTLAPLFTIGAGLGSICGIGTAQLLPQLGIDPRIAALVGMAAIFAGASRALLASAVFAFEITLQPLGLLPLLGGCTAAYMVSCLLMRNTLMTEKIARRGVRAPAEYMADVLDRVTVRTVASSSIVTLRTSQTLDEIRSWIATGAIGTSHQGFPVLDERGVLTAVVTRRNLLDPETPSSTLLGDLPFRPLKYIYADSSVRQAADHMVNHSIGRLPVVERDQPGRVIGMITRSDVLSAYRHSIEEHMPAAPNLRIRRTRVPAVGAE